MSNKTKFAMVITTFSVGGGQKVVLDLLKAMDKTRFDVKLFVHSSPVENQFTLEAEKNNIPIEFVPRDDRVSLGSYKRLSRALRDYDPDVVHVHLDTLYAPIWALFNKKRVIFTVHSQAHRAFNNRFYINLHRYLALHRDYHITAVSDTIADETEKLLKLSGKVTTVYNPVEIKALIERKENETVNFVNVARFSEVKNHRLLLEAFAKAHKLSQSLMLSLAGDGPLLEGCKAYAKELGIESRVSFLGNVEDVSSLLKGSDVFVLSSNSEALPISILEAMAHGLPIVSTRVGGVPDIVNENGILVPKGDADALCDAILEMARSSGLRQKCGEFSYQRVQEFGVENIVEKYQKLYLPR